MTGKQYYVTTLGDWKRHAGSFANSHWIALDPGPDSGQGIAPTERPSDVNGRAPDSLRILVLVEADEAAHGTLEGDASFEALPHPLSQKPISEVAQGALAWHGVVEGASTFDVAETVGRVHPLLRHRVF